jgi:tetratricopeptide (TPR) repeat protein
LRTLFVVTDLGFSRLAVVLAPGWLDAAGLLGAVAALWPDVADRLVLPAPPAAGWPFAHPLADDLAAAPAVMVVPDLHEAFVNRQTGGTRLVTTQATYLMHAWRDHFAESDVLLVAAADPASLNQHAPEILARRGPFADATIIDAPAGSLPGRTATVSQSGLSEAGRLLAAAFRAPDPSERLRLCVGALELGRTPSTLVAAASACMEVNDLDAAARDLDEALRQAPDWPAAHFERGKLWLRVDDMERASESFRRAATGMPGLASAWANLGATLGELDRPHEALAAFERALAADPDNPQSVNNVGVVSRELGRLPESEAAFRRVVELAPELAFGYYNLGHTLFLLGRYQAALGAYTDGQRRDPERNPVQASRLAMCRLASGDATGALAELQRATGALPREYRQQLLADTQAIAWALLTDRPDVPGWSLVNEWLASELARLA